MSIRTEFLTEKLSRFLARKSPPQRLDDQGRADEMAALARAIDRVAPRSDYDGWWLRFEEALDGGLTTRAWPTVREITEATRSVPVPKAADDAEGWLEAGLRNRVRRWLDGSPGDGEKGIPPHLVTRERLAALGLVAGEIDRVMERIADPYYHGIDKTLTHADRMEHARRYRHMQGGPYENALTRPA